MNLAAFDEFNDLANLRAGFFAAYLNKIDAGGAFVTSAVKGLLDVSVYGTWLVNPRHIHLVSKEGGVNPIEYFRLDKVWKSSKEKSFRKKCKKSLRLLR